MLGARYAAPKSFVNSATTDCRSDGTVRDKKVEADGCSTLSEDNNSVAGSGKGIEVNKQQILRDICRLRGVVTQLCAEIEVLEASVRHMKTGSNEIEHSISTAEVCSIGTQTKPILTYAETLKYGVAQEKPEKPVKPVTSIEQVTEKCTKSRKEEKKHNSLISNTTRVTKHCVKVNDVKNSEQNQTLSKQNTSNSDLPMAFFVHDSIMNGIEPERLGESYGAHILSAKASTADEIESAVESLVTKSSRPPDAIYIHCGINDIRRKHVESAAKHTAKCAQKIKKSHPNTKIIISQIAPTHESTLEVKRHLFNAIVTNEVCDQKEICIISHENIHKNKKYIRQDKVHPTMRGTSVLAGNVGRAIRDQVWETQRRRRPPRPHRNNYTRDKYYDHQTNWWNNRRNVLYKY